MILISNLQRVASFAAYKSAIREQKLNMVMSAAKREKDFYLSKVEKSRAMTEIDERMKKVLTFSNILSYSFVFPFKELYLFFLLVQL